MAPVTSRPLRTLSDIERFERELPFEERCRARSIYDVFAQAAEIHPHRTAITMVMTGEATETPRRVTFRELLGGITRAANLFREIAGSRPGVAFLLPNLVETHFVLWGAEIAGYAVPINPLLTPNHITELVRSAGAEILVALGPDPHSDIWEKACEVAKLLPDLKLIEVSTSTADQSPGVIEFHPAWQRQRHDQLDFQDIGRDDDIAAYFHTGGTTDAPKLVANTHRNQIVAAFGTAALLHLSEQDRATNGLPLFHVAGTITFSLAFFLVGSEVIILSPTGLRNPSVVQNFWRIVERYSVTVAGGVPTVISALLGVPVDADLSSVRISITGSAATPIALAEQFETHTGRTLHEIFGMTECAATISINPPGARVIGSAGFRIPYIQTSVRRLNPDGSLGDQCQIGEIGVLTISGPTVTPGYRNSKHNEALLLGQEISSGDLAYSDKDGRIYIAGRAKDLIIRSGHNIDPKMIEEVVQQHPAVALAAAVGQPDRYAGELPVCYVSLKPGARVTHEELRAFAEPQISERPAWPKQYYVIDQIPTTGVGKIFKPALRADATRRQVEQAIAAAIHHDEAVVSAVPGGSRGMKVTIAVQSQDSGRSAAIREALDGYLFEVEIVPSQSSGGMPN